MATLYVRNFPDELYHTLQELAGKGQRSIGNEVIELVADAVQRIQLRNRRMAAMQRIEEGHSRFRPSVDGMSTLDLLREDRER
jgi:plasmid stability protein